jgi:phage tail protein X
MPSVYSTVQGDTWDIIALRVYGSEKGMDVLINANPAYRETVFFGAGVVLAVPPAPATVNANLPPWRRGA